MLEDNEVAFYSMVSVIWKLEFSNSGIIVKHPLAGNSTLKCCASLEYRVTALSFQQTNNRKLI